MTSDSGQPRAARDSPERGKIQIWTALEIEAKAIRRGLGINQRAPGHGDSAAAAINESLVSVSVIGIKATHLPAANDTPAARLLILGGFGGGLHPDLAIGDVVVEPPPSLTVIEGPWKIGRITTQTDLVATPQAKAALFKRTGAWAVDMEADPVRRAAMSRALPLVVVRAITDTAAQSIDPRILAWIDPDGAPRAAAMALGLLRRPWLIVELIRLGRASRLAGLRLAAAVRHIVDNASEFIRP